jgi:acyl-CoA synthetase (AMP-forming)/AMP-acid ligase II
MLDEIVGRNALRFARKPALIGEGVVRTWAELDARVTRLANALRLAGLGRNDRVAILLGNCVEYFESYFACARAGLIAIPLNYRLTGDEMTHILRHAEPILIIVGAHDAQKAQLLGSRIESLRELWVVGDSSREGYEARLALASPDTFARDGAESDVFAIFFTSGTTGLPKGAMVSHRNLEANAFNQLVADGSRADDVNLVATPLYHVGAVFMAITYMMLGCTQVILPQFSAIDWLRAVAHRHANVSLLIPTMINAVLNERTLVDHDLSGLRLIFYGGGPMPPAVLERALKMLPCAFTQGYGLTETLEATFLVAADHVLNGTETERRRLSSAGREAVGAEVRIVDDSGTDLAPLAVGEILVRSRSVIAGYWRQPELNAETMRGDWFCTGDLGYLDKDRYLYVVDRKADMVVTGGVNVYTKDVEAVLYRHEGVREAAVFGVPDDNWGEMLVAAVAARDGAVLTEGALIDFCRDKLAGFKRPKRVILLPELPKNASGKILKRELKSLAGGR